jgi:hypothetical protein
MTECLQSAEMHVSPTLAAFNAHRVAMPCQRSSVLDNACRSSSIPRSAVVPLLLFALCSSSPWAFVHSTSQRRPVPCLLSTLHKLPQHNHSTPLVFHAVGAPQNVNETPLCPPSLCPSAFSSCAASSLHVAASFRLVCSAQLSIPPPYHTTLRCCSILRAPSSVQHP